MTDFFRHTIEQLLLSTNLGAATVSTLLMLSLIVVNALICAVIGVVCQFVILPLSHAIVKRTKTKLDDIFLNARFLKALSRTIPNLAFMAMLPGCLPEGTTEAPLSYIIVKHIADTLVTLSFVWVIAAMLNNIRDYANHSNTFRNYHIDGIIQFLKLMVYFIGLVIIISFIINKSPLTLFAGLGAAATVMMLIFKDSILGLVASIQISLNKMIKKEDWIIIDSKGVNGVVEEVNLTTVKVRNYDNSVSMIPPYSLVSEPFQNWGCMHEVGKRRVMRSILIDSHSIHFTDKQQTTTNLALFRHYAEEYLRNHPNVAQNEWLMARELEPTAHGLPLQLWFYLNITEFVLYEQTAAEIMEYLIASLPKFNLKVYQYYLPLPN